MENKKQELVESCNLCKTVASSKERDEYGADLDEWDGPDIYSYTNLVWRHVAATEKVKNILKKKKIESICFQRIEGYV